MVIVKKEPAYKTLQRWGRIVLYIYVLFSFITNSGYLSTKWHSLSLYLLVAIGLCSTLLSPKFLNKYLIWYGGFMILCLIAVFYAKGEWISTYYQMIVMFLLALSISQFVKTQKHIKDLFIVYTVSANLLFILLFISGRLLEDERLGTTAMGNANTFAAAYMIAIMFATWLFFYKSENKATKIFLFLSLAMNFVALLLSGGRKFIIVVILFAYLLLILKKDKNGKKHVVFYTIITLVFVALLYYLMMNVTLLYDIVGYRMEYLINMFVGEGDIGESNRVRQAMMSLAFWEGLESPIFGHGFDSFKYLSLEKLNFFAYSHNNWTEIWYNQGAIGFLVYYSFYAYMLVKSIALVKYDVTIGGFCMGAILCTFIFEYGAVTYYFYPLQILLCITVLLYDIANKGRKEKHEQNLHVVPFDKRR